MKGESIVILFGCACLFYLLYNQTRPMHNDRAYEEDTTGQNVCIVGVCRLFTGRVCRKDIEVK